ncbi:MAG TPA: FHA domain-containing protein [Methylotenera sp.]|nr:FHA domain-containing protein [Methylotenera sp.]HPH05965.1 FHA domain-containing protein [Methylotenera sp.]HPN00543.1 FHA domain-containing protein [Methylotenera sp.]
MAKILLFLENTLLAEYPLEKMTTHIGRRPNNDIHIDNLAVSGEHAAIVKMGQDYYIEDVGSTNGTTVNGDEIQKHLLQHGDVIELGKHQLKFIVEAVLSHLGTEQKAEDAGFEKTVILKPQVQKAAASEQTPTLAEEAAVAEPQQVVASQVETQIEAPVVKEPALAKIQVLNGASVGRELPLNKAMTTLGKTGLQVAVITKRANGFYVTHVEGKVFPVVNNQSVGAQAHLLHNHDVIEIAGVKMEFLS